MFSLTMGYWKHLRHSNLSNKRCTKKFKIINKIFCSLIRWSKRQLRAAVWFRIFIAIWWIRFFGIEIFKEIFLQKIFRRVLSRWEWGQKEDSRPEKWGDTHTQSWKSTHFDLNHNPETFCFEFEKIALIHLPFFWIIKYDYAWQNIL